MPHARHAVDNVDPVSGLYVPAPHALHVSILETSLYVPVGHVKHALTAVDPVSELYLPVPHVLHALSPGDAWSLYVPTGQLRHAANEFCPVSVL